MRSCSITTRRHLFLFVQFIPVSLSKVLEPATATLKRKRAQTYAQEKKAQIEALKAEEIKLRAIVREYEKTLELANQVNLGELGTSLARIDDSIQRAQSEGSLPKRSNSV